MRKQVGQKIHFEFRRRVANHHAVRIGSAEQVVWQFQFVVNLLGRGLLGGGRAARQFRRRAESLREHVEIRPQRLDELRQHGMRHHHTRGDLRRVANVLHEVQDEFVGAGHHDHARAKRAAADAFRHARRHVRNADLFPLRAVVGIFRLFWVSHGIAWLKFGKNWPRTTSILTDFAKLATEWKQFAPRRVVLRETEASGGGIIVTTASLGGPTFPGRSILQIGSVVRH